MTYALLFSVALAAIADVTTTHAAITLGAYEANPFAASIYAAHSWQGLLALKTVGVAGLALLLNLCNRGRISLLGYAMAAAMAGAWGLAAIWNLYVLSMLVN